MPTTHKCPAPDCATQLPASTLACRRHWYAIPAGLCGEIRAHYRPGQSVLTATPEYLDAVARIVEHLAKATS